MDVTPHELRTIELREAWRGYRQDDVDELLDRVAGTVERLQAQVKRLTERVARAEDEAGMGREADEMLRRTLLLAQRTADAAVSEAQERARRVVSESEAQAHSIVSGAEEEARRVAVSERQRLEEEVREMSRRRALLVADLEALEATTQDHRRRLREFMEAELARLESRPVPTPPVRPTLHEVPIPDAPDLDDDVPAGADESPFAEDADVGEGSEAAEAPTAQVDDVHHVDQVDEVDEATRAGIEVSEDAEQLHSPEADVGDERDEFDAFAQLDAGMADLLPRRRRRLRRPMGDDPDDEFFSELRAAVTDETPLGPVEADVDDSREGDVEHADTSFRSSEHDDRSGDGVREADGLDQVPDSPPRGSGTDGPEPEEPYDVAAGDEIDLGEFDGFELAIEEPIEEPDRPSMPDGAVFFDQDAGESRGPREGRDHADDAEWDEFDDGIPDGGRLRSAFRRRG